MPFSTLLLTSALALLPVASGAHEPTSVAAPKLESVPAATADPAPPKASARLGSQLPRLGRALRETGTAKVLAIGSSSTAGVGASSPSRTYTARLEADLETALTGTDFDVIGHGLSGEVAQGAADRMRREVEDVKPELVIWQVGTNDALRHVAIDNFKNLPEENSDVAQRAADRRRPHQSAVWRSADQGHLLRRGGQRRRRSGARAQGAAGRPFPVHAQAAARARRSLLPFSRQPAYERRGLPLPRRAVGRDHHRGFAAGDPTTASVRQPSAPTGLPNYP